MKLSKNSINIKELISDEVCMGTYGLVELELMEIDKQNEKMLKQLVECLIDEDWNAEIVIDLVEEMTGKTFEEILKEV